MRDVVSTLMREPHDCLSEQTRTYMRDVYDHTVQIIDIVETYREVAMGLTETYMTAMSNRLNEVIKVLTIIGTIFIPLTFLAGVYGMNFTHFPELHWPWAYPRSGRSAWPPPPRCSRGSLRDGWSGGCGEWRIEVSAPRGQARAYAPSNSTRRVDRGGRATDCRSATSRQQLSYSPGCPTVSRFQRSKVRRSLTGQR
jgi:hypothetical protein